MFFSKELVSSHYLNLLNDLASGIPMRILHVANSINDIKDFESLIARLNKPIVCDIRKKSIPKFRGLWLENRVKALELADRAKTQMKFRLAVQCYGLIVLMSESNDDPLMWAIYQLRDISENIYEMPSPSSNSKLLEIIKCRH